MIKITRTITLDGTTNKDYEAILHHLESTNSVDSGWELKKEPLINRITAIKKEEMSIIS